jgi:hypothetical protein
VTAPRLGLLLALAASPAFAHGANTQAYAVHVEGAGKALVNTTLGTFITADDGATWDWTCEEATGAGRSPTPTYFRSPSGAWFVHDYSGLSVSRDGLCNYERIAAFDATGVAGMAKSPGALWAVTGRYGQTNGVFASSDDGASWAVSTVSSATEFFSAIRVASSAPSRIYVSGWWFEPAYSMSLYVSSDGGAGFARSDLTAVLPEPGAFYVLAVHPQKPDVVLAALTAQRSPNPGIVLRSANGGVSWAALFESPLAVNEIAFSEDGARAWVAAGNTLYESTDEGASFAALAAPTRDACATAVGQTLYACGNELIDGFVAGRKTGAADFSPFFNWSGVTGQRACAAGSAVEQKCTAIWPVARAAIELLRADSDGGPGGGAGGAGGGGGGVSPPPCGCSSAPPALAVAGALLLLRRRTPKRW